MDGNLWGGPKLITGDPNVQNLNGRLFQSFLEAYPHLILVNSLEICEGKLTRVRKTVNREEKSILDFFIICDKLLPYVKKMVIDENKEFILTSYQKKNGQTVVKESDHMTLLLDCSINFYQKTEPRQENFNFRNKERLLSFKNIFRRPCEAGGASRRDSVRSAVRSFGRPSVPTHLSPSVHTHLSSNSYNSASLRPIALKF